MGRAPAVRQTMLHVQKKWRWECTQGRGEWRGFWGRKVCLEIHLFLPELDKWVFWRASFRLLAGSAILGTQ